MLLLHEVCHVVALLWVKGGGCALRTALDFSESDEIALVVWVEVRVGREEHEVLELVVSLPTEVIYQIL